MTKNFDEKIAEIRKTMAPFKAFIKRPAKGALKFDYLVPGGYYQEQWDWDAFFMGVALSSEISSEAIYLRNWALNYILNADSKGYSPACVTPKGPEGGHRKMVMKPFLAQGIYISSKFLNDYVWYKPYWNQIKKIVLYRYKNLWNTKYNLPMWTNSMESGADDNVASFGYPDKTVISTDVVTYVYREFMAMGLLARKLKKTKEAEWFSSEASKLKKNILKHLWNDEDKIFYNLDTRNGEHIKRVTISSYIPLWEGLAPTDMGKESIKRHLLNPAQLFSKYGIRTLSKQDKDYNNVNRIHPFSNWQGPVWPIANYFYLQALNNYGFKKEAEELSNSIFELVKSDIQKTGGMHENYDAETGKPLAGPNFVSWNLLVGNMLYETVNNINPFKIK